MKEHRERGEPVEVAGPGREALELLRVTLSSIGDGVISTDDEGRVSYVNPVAEALTGFSQADARGRPFTEVFRIVNEETRRPVQDPVARVIREGRILGLANHTLLLRRDGSETPIDDSAAPIRDREGRVRGVVVVFRSVAERRRAEREAARLAAIVESSQDAIVSKDLDGLVLTWNGGAEQVFGWRADEIIGRSITLLIPPDRLDEERQILESVRRGERVEHYETVRRRKDGRLIQVSLAISPIRDGAGRIVGASKVARDISARAEAEARIRESEAQFRSLANALPAIVWTATPEGAITFANDVWFDYTGLAREGGMSGWAERVLHPDDRDAAVAAWRASLRDGAPIETELRNRRHDGAYRWFLSRGVPVRDAAGGITRWVGSMIDIDDRKRLEGRARFLAGASAALAATVDRETALRRLTRLAVPTFADWCAVDLLEPDGSIRRVEVAHVDPAKEAYARELHARYPARRTDARGVGLVLREKRSDHEAFITDELLERGARDPEHLRIARSLGLRSYVSVPLRLRGQVLGAITFVTAESGREYGPDDVAVAEDLAARAAVALENASLVAAMRDADRRKDEFLAMLSHELRNPLAPISNAAALLRAAGPGVPGTDRAVEVIDRQVRHLARLVDDLLDVSRITWGKVELRREVVELGTVIRAAVEESRGTIERRGHALALELPGEPIALDADPIRLAQVLSNLLVNAAKYTDPGGHIRLSAARDGDEARVTVRDDGIGIPAAALPRIFELLLAGTRHARALGAGARPGPHAGAAAGGAARRVGDRDEPGPGTGQRVRRAAPGGASERTRDGGDGGGAPGPHRPSADPRRRRQPRRGRQPGRPPGARRARGPGAQLRRRGGGRVRPAAPRPRPARPRAAWDGRLRGGAAHPGAGARPRRLHRGAHRLGAGRGSSPHPGGGLRPAPHEAHRRRGALRGPAVRARRWSRSPGSLGRAQPGAPQTGTASPRHTQTSVA
ncbi:MAG: PAS domain S-box protein [Anaeromyxobacteraceae bacterium]